MRIINWAAAQLNRLIFGAAVVVQPASAAPTKSGDVAQGTGGAAGAGRRRIPAPLPWVLRRVSGRGAVELPVSSVEGQGALTFAGAAHVAFQVSTMFAHGALSIHGAGDVATGPALWAAGLVGEPQTRRRLLEEEEFAELLEVGVV